MVVGEVGQTLAQCRLGFCALPLPPPLLVSQACPGPCPLDGLWGVWRGQGGGGGPRKVPPQPRPDLVPRQSQRVPGQGSPAVQ